jgi:4'-phosphopantetheinyl transferase
MLFGLGDDPPVSWRPAPSAVPDPAGEVHVWRAWLDRGERPDEAGLPAEERARAAAIQIAARRRRWVAARWALRVVLSRYAGVEPAELRIESGERGKPSLSGGPNLRFNLSHSGELALIAVAGGREVGVDVERIRPDRPAEYLRDWTRREAAAKCAGTGLGGPPPDGPGRLTDVDPGPGWVAALALRGEGEAPIRLFELEP